jgi:hypothetical protein
VTFSSGISTVRSTTPSGANRCTAPPPYSATQMQPSSSTASPSRGPTLDRRERAPVRDLAVGVVEDVDALRRRVDEVHACAVRRPAEAVRDRQPVELLHELRSVPPVERRRALTLVERHRADPEPARVVARAVVRADVRRPRELDERAAVQQREPVGKRDEHVAVVRRRARADHCAELRHRVARAVERVQLTRLDVDEEQPLADGIPARSFRQEERRVE